MSVITRSGECPTECPIWGIRSTVRWLSGWRLERKRRRAEALRRVFGVMVSDVIDTSRARLAQTDPQSVEELRAAGRPMVRFSDALFADLKDIRAFLFSRMYRAPSVVDMRSRVTRVVEELFPLFMARPDLLPEEWQQDVEAARDETARARLVADYIAGMTDRFALQQHGALTGQT